MGAERRHWGRTVYLPQLDAVSRILRQARARRGWSQERLAERAEVSVRTLRAYEQGEPVDLRIVCRLCIILRVDLGMALVADAQAEGRSRWT